MACTIAIAVGVLMETGALSEQRDLASDRARTLAERTLVPALSGTDLSRPPSGPSSQQLQGLLNSVLLGSEAGNVVVWNPQGSVVMSDRASQIGSEARAPDALKRALRGRGFAYAIGNEFRVVVPIRADPEAAVDGVVVVVYDDATLRAAAANPGRIFTYGATALLLIALGLAPFLFRGTAAAVRRGAARGAPVRRGGTVPLQAGLTGQGARPRASSGAPPGHMVGPPTRGPQPPPQGTRPAPPPIAVPPSARELEQAKEHAWKADERAALAERQAATAQDALEQAGSELRRVTEEAHQLRGRLEAAGVSAQGEPAAALERELRAVQEEAVTLRATLAQAQALLADAEHQRRGAEQQLREVLAAQAAPETSAPTQASHPAEAGPSVDAVASSEETSALEPEGRAPGSTEVPVGVPDYVIAAERAAAAESSRPADVPEHAADAATGTAAEEAPPVEPKRPRSAIAARLADALHRRPTPVDPLPEERAEATVQDAEPQPYAPNGEPPLPVANHSDVPDGDAPEEDGEKELPELTEEDRLKLREQMMRRRSREEFRRRQLGSPDRP